jgi:hypothetical protein
MLTASQFHLAEFNAMAGHQQSLPDPFWLLLEKNEAYPKPFVRE